MMNLQFLICGIFHIQDFCVISCLKMFCAIYFGFSGGKSL